VIASELRAPFVLAGVFRYNARCSCSEPVSTLETGKLGFWFLIVISIHGIFVVN
jgi:hypothetical protein